MAMKTLTLRLFLLLLVLTCLEAQLVITQQPANQTVAQGSNVALTVAVSGTGPFTYQWLFNGTNVPNVGTITTVAGNGTFAYSVDGWAATNAGLNRPSDVTVDASGNLFIADQSNNRIREVSYTGMPILTVNSVSTATAGDYSVIITGASGSVTSSVASLTVLGPPVIASQPESQTIVAGTNVTLAVIITSPSPINCQWFFNSAKITGATNISLTLSNVTTPNQGTFFVIVANVYGSATSSVATLTVLSPPIIVQSSASQSQPIGNRVTFAPVVQGTPPLNYQWYFWGSSGMFWGKIIG